MLHGCCQPYIVRKCVTHKNYMMHTKRKLRLHGILDKNVEEAILRELKRHDGKAYPVYACRYVVKHRINIQP